MDADGNGAGDFAGLTSKLDYLHDLGVDCLWILPMYPSPLRDDGYDIADFYGIHPSYGSVEDFQKFLDAAHDRGLRVIADLVMNHTSDAHPWFQAARSDPVPYLVEREGTSCENLPETHAILKEFRRVIDAEYDGRVLLAEANQWPEDVRPYFAEGDEFHMAFHFPLMPRLYMGVRREDRLPITDIFTHTPAIPPHCQWCLFLRNHDELTPEMVTNEERDYMYYAYASDPSMKLNLGIRRRLAPLMDNDRRRIELLNCLLLTLPGSPII